MPLNTPAPAASRSIHAQEPLTHENPCFEPQIEQAVSKIGQHIASDLKAAGFSQKAEIPALPENPINHSGRLNAKVLKPIVGLQVVQGRGPVIASLSGNQILREVLKQVKSEFQPRQLKKIPMRNFLTKLTQSLTELGMTMHCNEGNQKKPVAGSEMVGSKLRAKISQHLRDIPSKVDAQHTSKLPARRASQTDSPKTHNHQDGVECGKRKRGEHPDQPGVQDDLNPLPLDAEMELAPEVASEILKRLRT